MVLGSTNGMSQPAANDLISGSISQYRGLAYGLKQCALPLAAVIGSIGFSQIALRLGWRSFYLTVVLLALAVALVASVTAQRIVTPPSVTNGRIGSASSRVRSMPRLLFVGGAGAFVGNAMTTFYIPSLTTVGIDPGSAAWAMGVGSTVGVGVRLLLGLLWDRTHFDSWKVIAVQFWIWGSALLLLSQMTSFPVGVVVAVLGFGIGWAWPGLFHLALSGMNRQSVARATSIIMLGVYVGGLLGPLIVGIVVASVSYGVAWLLCAALCCVNGFVCISMGRDRRDELNST